ncbi:sigma-54 interaction domain-containing protein [Brevibacillus sp. SIMBA_040]|uniref:sigma-54 interaction domain-containing protein n=1 Tax=unclassified Brevibacillus TaxID=2684853 RepID=UPI003978F912
MEELRAQSKQWEQIFSVIREGVLVVDLDLRVTYVNEAVQNIGIYPEKVIGENIFQVFPNLKQEHSHFVKVLATGQPITDKVLTFVTYRGERKTTLTSTFPLYENGVLTGAFEVFQDISAIDELSKKIVFYQNKERRVVPQNKKHAVSSMYTVDSIIGNSHAIDSLKDKVSLIADSFSPVLIYGETGTGKELIAQSIHTASAKKTAPFIAQNCAAIPESLLEGILFGTEKGGFTGADNRPGLFELANGGILFLDEINSMPLSLQAKLLRVIQEKKVRRVGGQKEIDIDFRIVAATNVNPEVILQTGEMRSDLFYRLNVIYLELPPLRNRREDIPLLIDHYISYYNEQFNKKVLGVNQEAMSFFMEYTWPGNIRELRNMIERAMNMQEGEVIQLEDVNLGALFGVSSMSPATMPAESRKQQGSLKDALKEVEVEMIKQALLDANGNVSKAARKLDIPQQTINHKIDKYTLRPFIYQIKLNATQK